MDFKLHYWPPLICGWFMLTFIISYTVAVASGTVHPFLPYISELGLWQPSNVIFGQMLNIGAVLVAVGYYIRYRQIDFIIKTRITKLRKRWNEIAFYLGFLSAFGLCLVANFPGYLKGYRFIFGVHMIGAFLTFGFGFLYLIIQNKITFDLQPYYDRYPKVAVSKSVQYLRLAITIFYGISHIIASKYFMAFLQIHDGDLKYIVPGSPGYTDHLVSAFAEWAMAFLIFGFTMTVTNELKHMSFKEICFENSIRDNNNKRK